jgi:hypothetical protein
MQAWIVALSAGNLAINATTRALDRHSRAVDVVCNDACEI